MSEAPCAGCAGVFAGFGTTSTTRFADAAKLGCAVVLSRPNSGQRTGEDEYERNSAFTMFSVLPFSCLSDAPILSGLNGHGIDRIAVVFPKWRMRAFAGAVWTRPIS
jgi:hypothetical protein